MADAKLQIVIDAVDNASKQIKGVVQNLNALGAQARQTGISLSIIGGGAVAAMTLAIKSTADGQKAFEELTTTVDELQRTIGATLVPVIETLNEVLKPIVATLIEFTNEHPKVVQALFLIAGAAVILGAGLFLVGTVLRIGVGGLGLLRLAIIPLLAFLGPQGLLILGIGALVILLLNAVGAFDDLGKTVHKVVTTILTPFVGITWLIIKGLSFLTGQVAPSFDEIMRDTLADLSGFLQAIPPVLNSVVEGVNKVTGLDLPNVSEVFEGLKGVFDNLTGSLKFLADAWTKMGNSASTASAQVKAVAGNFGTTTDDARKMALLGRSVSGGTLFEAQAEIMAQARPGGLGMLQAFRAGERSPELLEFIRLLIRLIAIQQGEDPEYRARQGETFNFMIDGRTVASILGGQASVGEQVRSS